MVSSRRLVTDQASLRRSQLPPNYLFPEGDSSMPDDLTQVTVLVTGAKGTPYSQGLWRLHLRLPEDYPKNPPKAIFKTRIFHPNVEETTGAVCLETLKRDWDPKLTLRDVLITISCLLIQPNPDSALNSTAGSLLQEDYEAFARQARLMTSIHAPIPGNLRQAVQEAKLRGEDADTRLQLADKDERPVSSRVASAASSSSVIMKKKAINNSASQLASAGPSTPAPEDEEEEEEHDPAKENDPSLSPMPVTPPAPLSPRRSALGKRPLSDLPTPTEPEVDESGMTSSQRNVSANCTPPVAGKSQIDSEQPLRKSPKLAELPGTNTSGRIRDSSSDESKLVKRTEEEKENLDKNTSGEMAPPRPESVQCNTTSLPENGPTKVAPPRPALRKTSTASSSGSSKSNQARIGIRRL